MRRVDHAIYRVHDDLVSSATRYDPAAARNIQTTMADRFMDRNKRLGMSPRQQRLNRLYSFYACCQYDARRVAWDGREHLDPIETDVVATQGFIPPGFYDAGANFPLRFRRPTAPYQLVRVVVNRFTGLLFSEGKHPEVRVVGDAQTEDFVKALVEESRLWQAMILARHMGGAMGTVVMGFQFLDGKPVIEIHDPRWTRPEFKDRAKLTLRAIEKRYQYPVEVEDEKGTVTEEPYWYRRIIDEQTDTVFVPEPVGDGDEPNWQIDKQVKHGLGFCPVVWVQNLPVIDDVDGEADCHGVIDLVEEIDRLIAQAGKSIISNCDPTVFISTTDDLAEVRVGSDNALKLTNGSASFLESNLGGPKAAMDHAKELRGIALEVAQCVLEHPDVSGGRTATEIERVYSSMLEKASMLREQYGQKGVLPLLEMMVKAARALAQPRREGDAIVRGVLNLPPRYEETPEGMREVERQLGPGGVLSLQWPPFAEPNITDAQTAAQAAGAAMQLGLIDDEHAVKFVAPYFRVEDASKMLEAIKQMQRQQIAQTDTLSMHELPLSEE